MFLLIPGLTLPAPRSSAQDTATVQADIQDLIAKLRSEDDEVRQDAAAALAKKGNDAAQPLLETLDKEQGYARVYVARVILDNDRGNQHALTALLEAARNKKERPEVRRYAAYALALIEPHGLRALVGMLKDQDTFVRRSAVFALDELMEIRAHLGLNFFVILKSSFPQLLATTGDADEVVRGVSLESLAQYPEEMGEILTEAKQNKNKELQKIVKTVLEEAKKKSQTGGVGFDLELKPGYEEPLTKSGNFIQGTLGIIHAIAIGGGPVRDFRSIPGKLEGNLILHVVVNPRTLKARSSANRFNPYMDLK